MGASQAERLLAEGAPLTLTDGREVRVRFDMRAVVLAEKQFGSLKAMGDELNKNPSFTARLKALACGLHAEGLGFDALVDSTLPSQRDDMDIAINAAIAEAFPDDQAEPDPNPPGEENSPGPTGTTPPPSPSVEVTASSGA